MKTRKLLTLVILVLLVACSPTGEKDLVDSDVVSPSSDGIDDTQSETQDDSDSVVESPSSDGNDDTQTSTQEEAEKIATSGPDCYTEGIHPIGESISDTFEKITTYEEVMVWFCNGAVFEDILNALTTEELTDVDADDILHMVAEGYSWDDIWLELGVTEE